jgi:hypothetical protein
MAPTLSLVAGITSLIVPRLIHYTVAAWFVMIVVTGQPGTQHFYWLPF